MYKPLEGKAIRFGPGHKHEPAARIWKVWAEGSEVYALGRNPLGSAKVSVHASGQIHYRLGPKQKQDMAPLTPLGHGPWFHAVELRFLLSKGALLPPKERESLKKNMARIADVPNGSAFYANLVIGSAGTPIEFPLPIQGVPLWHTRLNDDRLAVLIGRVMPLDDENRGHIKRLREGPTLTFSKLQGDEYAELYDVHWSPGGNIILIVPLGKDSFRSEEDYLPADSLPTRSRQFHYRSRPATVDVIAPNGSRVAVIELAETDKHVELVKGIPKVVELGSMTLRLEPDNLIAGSAFMASPRSLVCALSVGGVSPRSWEYTIPARFDGFRFSAEIQQKSIAFLNKNFVTPVSELGDREELVFAMPSTHLTLSATLDLPSTSNELLGRFTLRDIVSRTIS